MVDQADSTAPCTSRPAWWMWSAKNCAYTDCKKVPVFNIKGQTTGIYCKANKQAAMVNVISKKYEREACSTQPTFSFKGAVTQRFCSTHKLVGIVQVHGRRCEHDSCANNAAFNIKGLLNGCFCLTHREYGTVNVIWTICKMDGCHTQTFFGDEHIGQRRFCAVRLPGMVCKHRNANKHAPSFSWWMCIHNNEVLWWASQKF